MPGYLFYPPCCDFKSLLLRPRHHSAAAYVDGMVGRTERPGQTPRTQYNPVLEAVCGVQLAVEETLSPAGRSTILEGPGVERPRTIDFNIVFILVL